MRASAGLALALAACGGDKTTGSGDTGDSDTTDPVDTTDTDTTPTDTTDPTDSGTTAPCVVLADGRWEGDGPAFGMTMTGTLTMDVAGCTFAFSDWSMAMSVPDGGIVVGDTVTFTGAMGWDSCEGQVNPDGTGMAGDCDFGAFTMMFQQ
jgi:hypothetical protein